MLLQGNCALHLKLALSLLLTQQGSGAERAQEATMSDNPPSSHQEEQLAAVPDGDMGVADPETSTGPNTKDQEETDAEKRETIKAEQQETEEGGGEESDGEEGKGVKRKREEVHREDEAGQSTEKKRVKNSWLILDSSIYYLLFRHMSST